MKRSTWSRWWRERALLLLLLLVGAGLRLWDTGLVPPGLYHDEAQHGLDALTVLETGHVPLYFPANNGREPFFIYLVTLGVAVLGRSPLAVRLPSFFVGFLTLAATYDLARVMWGRRAGRWALAVLAVTFWHVHLSRIGFRAVLLPLFTALFLAQLARALRNDKSRISESRISDSADRKSTIHHPPSTIHHPKSKIGNWIAAGAFYGASWYTYMAARFTPVALGVMIVYGLLFHRGRTLQAWRGALIFCVIALLVLAPLGVYTLRHPDIVLARTGQVTILSPEINGGDFWGTLLKHTLRTAGMFVVRGDRIWRHNLAWRPVWGPALGLAFLIGVGVALAGFRRNAGAALALLWTAVMALPTLLAEDAPHFLRAVGVLPTAVLFPTLGLLWIEGCALRVVGCGQKVESADERIMNHESRIMDHASRITHHVSSITPRLPSTVYCLLTIAFLSTTYAYFVRYARAPLAYHWFEAGPVAMAGEINALLGEGWDGEKMLHGPATGRRIYVERQLWDSWTAVPFLVVPDSVRFLSVAAAPDPVSGLTFVVWPYHNWKLAVFSHIPHPAYLRIEEGPQAQGDKDEQPFTVATLIHADPRPPVPEPAARFEGGIVLRAALVHPGDSGATVRLWWETDTPLYFDYTVFVHYVRDGAVIAQHDAQPGRGHLRTTGWATGDLILDEHPLSGIVPDPARDRLRIGLYRSDTGDALSRLDDAGNPTGNWVEVGVILAP
ncbi:MAG: ArnT family glycosyltransferase [Anaerolineae bacterium]